MRYDYRSLKNISNDDIVELIKSINTIFNANLPITTTAKTEAWNRRKNVEVLCDWLNNRNAHRFIKNDLPNAEEIDSFIIHEHKLKQILDDSHEQHYQDILKRDDYFEEDINEEDERYFNTKQQQIEREFEIKEAINRAYEAVDDAIQLIKEQKHPVLQKTERLIIPEAPLIKNHQKQYFPENEELYEYLDKFAHNFTSKHSDFLMINEPHDFDRAVNEWNHYNKYPSENTIQRKDSGKPITTYYFNQVASLDNIFECLHNVYKKELKPFKVHFQLSGVFETYTYDFESLEEKYDYKAKDIIWKNYQSMIPIIISKLEDLDIVKLYIESVLHSYETESSSTKLTLVGSIAFTVSRMRKITGRIKDLPIEFIKNDFIICDNEDDKLCFFRFLAVCLNEELANTKKYKTKERTKIAKKLLLKEHNIIYNTKIPNEGKKILNEFEGVSMEQMKDLAQKNHINVNIYEFHKTDSEQYYDLSEQWFFDKTFTTYSALLFTQNQIIHIMYIKNPEKLTQIHICPKCNSYIHYGSKNFNRFDSHVKHCDGVFKKNFIPVKEALPYCPHILNNPVYEYCLAYNLQWKPEIYYITYDFETMEQSINKSISNSTTINSRLIPLSVSSCVKSSNGLTTKNFSLRDSQEFIPQWIKWLFEQSMKVYADKISYYESFLPDTSINKNMNVITVLGFNSSRFDSNLFKQYFNHSFWKVEQNSIIGTLSSLKQFILTSDNHPTKLRFIDAQSFVAGGTLKQFGEDFGNVIVDSNVSVCGGINELQSNTQAKACDIKGVFPYEAINDKNYNEVLSKSEPFSYDDFYSYLNQKNPLTKEEYDAYLEDSKRFATRWDYLLAYNDNDVEMMIKPIDNLIALNAQYNVDLLSNLSLSKNASCIKYALAYKDFDEWMRGSGEDSNPRNNIGITNKYNTFKPSKKWWQYKCDSYYNQDEKYNRLNPKKPQRDLTKCVSENDFEAFMKMYDDPNKGRCHLCHEHFTYQNKPTLDRIDNNKGHQIDNCLLACAECNKLRKRDDPKITALRIQLKKYCKLHHLPTLINDEREYYSIRNAITGGLSNVMHRVNIKDETHINKFRYIDNKGVLSYDTSNVQSHVVGIDFNSLYPSSFSSCKHEFNKYHGGIMYMPGAFIRRIDVKDKASKKRCLDIITNSSRFSNKPSYLFYAEVKLKCPTSKINYFINLPPVFRNINIKNDESTIGTYMYNYMKTNKLTSTDMEERKLTMLLDTHDEYMIFSNYYLWFLLDHGLIIDDVKSVSQYEAHTGFNEFVSTFMQKRQDIISGVSKGNEKFYKISMNGSYGYDGMNSEKFSKVKICDANKAYQYIISQTYMGGAQLSDNTFLIQQSPKSYHCNTCIQESLWTLDNAKFWYLTFYYDFMNNCFDMDRLHFIEGDTDSAYFAVAGNPNEGPEQLFDYVIKNKEFYDKNVYKFMPNPSINTIQDEKKILGCAIEKYGENMIALAPKCYTIFNSNGQTKSLKLKGVSLKKNHIVSSDYKSIIDNQSIKLGKNINLQMQNNKMSKITVNKNALTGCHTKMIVLPNQSCAPFVSGLTANNYFINYN